MTRIALVVLSMAAMSVGACGGPPSGAGTIRFHNRAPVWRVSDRKPIAKPANRPYMRTLYQTDGYVVRRVTRYLEFKHRGRAANTNSMDEVPNSTWFTNRIGVRDITLDEMRRGPNTNVGEPAKPWTITGAKEGGTAIGFLMKDANGVKYLLKFDAKAYPDMETGADIVVARILWALGYHVPEDDVVYFTDKEISVAPTASRKDTFGRKTPLSAADVKADLAKVYKDESGRYRGLVSKYITGIPIAGYPREGVRKDDPNDVIAHERRRELRGQWPIFTWLAHTDMQEDNTLDAWIDDKKLGRRYVKHYLIDFGKALGVMAYVNQRPTVGYSHLVDFGYAFTSIFTLGLRKRPWEGQRSPRIRGVGVYDADHFLPGQFRTNSPYWAYHDKDRFDAFWGAKLLIRLSPAHLRVAVQQAKYTDPRATEYMVGALIKRQRKTARYWFKQVNPLDTFAVRTSAGRSELCFDDLLLKYSLEPVAAKTRYEATAYDYSGRDLGLRATASSGDKGRACIKGVPAGAQRDGYTIVRITTRRGGSRLGPVLVHMAHDPSTKAMRIIGLRRE